MVCKSPVLCARWCSPLALSLLSPPGALHWRARELMDLTVRQHIERLQSQLTALNSEFMDETDPAKRNQLESEIRAIELALSHFESALELENKILPQR